MDTLNLAGKIAIVTGGGTGIGRAIALALASAGVKVVISGRRPDPLQAVAQEIVQRGQVASAVPGDISLEGYVTGLVAWTFEQHGAIDIVVNNAGISGSGQIHEHDIAEWDRVLATNLRGPFLLCRAVLPHMRRQGAGQIINISSESGLEHYPGNGAYGVSKHALNALAEYIQRENQDYGVRFGTICPGMVVTPMSDSSVGLDRQKCLYPDDIADLVMWLLTRRPNVKIGRPILIQTMQNPWVG